MEHTVETLLSHSGTPDDLIAKIKRGQVPSDGGGEGPTTASGGIDADEELARQLAREDRQSSSSGRFVPPGQRRMMASNARAPPARPISTGGGAPAATPAAVSQVKKGRGTPTTLPNDFLRIPGRKYPQQPEMGSAGGVGGMTDEQLARMLQDELFQEELRSVVVLAISCKVC